MFIITAVGPDTPGMAHALAQELFEAQCNLKDTTMTRLSGQFAMILAVAPPADLTLAALQARLQPLRDSHRLTIDVAPAPVQSPSAPAAPRHILTAYGPETSGLLARLTQVLAEQRVNVTDVQTRVASAGMVYVMLLELELPLDMGAEGLEDELRRRAPDLQVSLRALEEETL